jgi:hypothetical protein
VVVGQGDVCPRAAQVNKCFASALELQLPVERALWVAALISSKKGAGTYHRLFRMQRRFFLNSELVIKRLLRSVISKPKRSSTLREEEFATSNVGA